MIFSCARCETRYKLPDDKVTNRVVKVRCRRCGVIIVVRDPSRPQSASVETEAVWFAAIDGEQRGPLTAGALQQLVEGGVLTPATFIWKVGMGDWLVARDVPEILALIESIGPPPIPDSEAQERRISAMESPLESAVEVDETLAASMEAVDREQASTSVDAASVALGEDPTVQVSTEPVGGLSEPWDEAASEDIEHDETVAGFDANLGLPEPWDKAASEDIEHDETVAGFDATSGLDEAPAGAADTVVGAMSTDVELLNQPSDSPVSSASAEMEEDATIAGFDASPPVEETPPSDLEPGVDETAREEAPSADPEPPGEAPRAPESSPAADAPPAAGSGLATSGDEPGGEADEAGDATGADPPGAATEAQDVPLADVGPLDPPLAAEVPDGPAVASAGAALEATPDPGSEYEGGLGDDDPTLKIQKPDLASGPEAAPLDDAPTVQDVPAAPAPGEPSEEGVSPTSESSSEPPVASDGVDPLAAAATAQGTDAGPVTRVEPLPEATIDTQAAGAPPSQDMATQPEAEAAPPEEGGLELADDLFAGIEGAMNTEELKELAAPKPLSTMDLIRAPDLAPEPEATAEDKAFFKQAMRSGGRVQAMSITAMEAVDKKELRELRQEFGVIGELEAARRKRKLIALMTTLLVVAGVSGAVSMYQTQREDLRAANRMQFATDASDVPVAIHRAVYDAARDQVDEAEEARIEAERAKAEEQERERLAAEKQARADKWETQKAYMAEQRAKRSEESRNKYNNISASDYKKLMTDSSGKSEVKLKFSAREQADKVAKEAAAKRKKKGDVRASEVVATFGRKRRQLARCKSGSDEKVRAQFTVAPNGRVTGVKVTGTQSSKKRDCVKGILKQAIFPKGPETNTYAMPFTL